MEKSSNKTMLFIILAVIIAIVAYFVLNAPDTRTTTEKVGDAVQELPKGPEKAERELEDRTPGEKVGDAVKDAGEGIKNSTDGQ
jgi:hypothetical protein